MALLRDDRFRSVSSESLVHEPRSSSRPFKRRRIQQNENPPLSPYHPPGAPWNLIEEDQDVQERQECGYPTGIQPSHEWRLSGQTQPEVSKIERQGEEEVCFGMVSTQVLGQSCRLTVYRLLICPFG